MDSQWNEWLALIGRWFHIITGIAWIGTSFFFVWLDSHLTKPVKDEAGKIMGELWMVHSGGYYKVEKRPFAPHSMPKLLHWFKWEAYLTWLSGFFLLGVIYYSNGAIYLIDADADGLSATMATFLGSASLIIGWLVYDFFHQSPLAKNDMFAKFVSVLFVVFSAWFYSYYFSGRAAFIHMGALLGTCMVGNVFFRIIPAQKKMIAQTERGEEPDLSLGFNAKKRSLHNNHMTFPVIFLMISNHFPTHYGHEKNWVVLLLFALLGALINYYVNKQPKGKWVFAPAILVLTILIYMAAPVDQDSEAPTTTAIQKEHHHEENQFTQEEQEELESVIEEEIKNPIGETYPLKGFVIYKGAVAKPKKLRLPKACATQHQGAIFDRSLLVKNKKLKNALVHIKNAEQLPQIEIPQKNVEMDQRGCLYYPKVVGVRVGQAVEFINSDPVFHNVRGKSKANKGFNINMRKQHSRQTKIFTKPELFIHARCNLHPWMKAFIGVFNHGYFAVTDDNGKFELPAVPAGEYELELWHQTLGTMTQKISVNGQIDVLNIEFKN